MTKKQRIWGTDLYYEKARKGSLEVDHPGMRLLKEFSQGAKTILDLGCGEGTRLNWLTKDSRKKGTGVDISAKAIKMAKKSYPSLGFAKENLENLDFKSGSFDLVYSAYVLEHLGNAERMIKEAIRVTKKGGKLVFIAPNFGAPNRASPFFKGTRTLKLFKGLLRDALNTFYPISSLNWNTIGANVSIEEYKSDYDTTLEPYLGTLIKFLKKSGIKIEKATSCWNQELSGVNTSQKLLGGLGKLGLYPFWMWGPHLVVVGRKV